jgi:acyl transferase domain-containing protein
MLPSEDAPAGERPTSGIVFMFAGQGSQYPGMTKALYDDDPVFRAELDSVDEVIAVQSGRSVLPDVYAAGGRFDDVMRTHPAIFAVQYALARSLMRRGLAPDYVLGLSTGEFAAAAVGGATSLEDAVYGILEQARVLAETCGPGGMLAVIRPPSLYNATPALSDRCTLALAGRSYFVVASQRDAIDDAVRYLSEQGIAHRRLPVTQGFHSPLIESARGAYLSSLAGHEPGRPSIPLTSCAAADVLQTVLPRDHFWQAISQPMRFTEAVRALALRGRHVYLDLGPGSALTTLLKESEVDMATLHTLVSPQGDELRSMRELLPVRSSDSHDATAPVGRPAD